MSDFAATLQTLLDHFILADVHRDGRVPQLQASPEGYRYWRQLSEASVLICQAHDASDPVLAGISYCFRERWGGLTRETIGHAVNWLVAERSLTRDQALALPLAELLARLRGRRNGMTVAEANEKALMLAKQNPAFVHSPLREWAAAIGCSEGQVANLPLWQKTMRQSGRGTKGATPAPKAQSLNEAVTGEGGKDAELNRLISEHEADREPSSLDPDPTKKVHYRKRV
jgi:hypothetical protein